MTTVAKESGLDVAIRVAEVGDLWSRDQVNLMLKEYAAKGTTVEEFSAFLIIAKDLHLNPFLHEIWLPDFDGSGRNRAPYVGRDGLLAIAERSGQFDGLVSGVVYEGDTFELGSERPTHTIGAGDRGRIRFAYAYVYRKDRRYPTSVIAERGEFLDPKVLDEQGQPRTGGVTKTPWFRFPSLMLKKVAEANALRLCFKVSGVVAVADNATPVDQGDVIEVDGIEVVEESSPTQDAAGIHPEAQQPGDSGSARSGSTKTPRPAASSEAPAAHRETDAPAGTPSDTPGGEPELFPPSQDELDALAADQAEHRDPQA
jgi:phage recombination protein Bet